MAEIQLRALNPEAPAEIERIAQGMRATLIEVEGEAVGSTIHSLDGLREGVRCHLSHPCAAVGLALDGEDTLGHSIVREEREVAQRYGLVSTPCVLPAARRRGIAQRLVDSRTWTGAGNGPLIRLHERQGDAIAQRAAHEGTGTAMVCLARAL